MVGCYTRIYIVFVNIDELYKIINIATINNYYDKRTQLL
jgi:hypothetical protein